MNLLIFYDASIPFHIGNEELTKLVAKDTIVEMDNQKFICTIIDRIATPIKIETSLDHESLKFLKVGIDVIVRGNERIKPGQPVKITKKGLYLLRKLVTKH